MSAHEALSLSLLTIVKLKTSMNLIWTNEILPQKEDFLSLLKAHKTHYPQERPQIYETQASFLADLAFLETLLENTAASYPQLRSIALGIWLLNLHPAQRDFAEILFKLEKEAEELWRAPEKIPELRCEKILLFSKELEFLGKKAFSQLQAESDLQRRLVGT